MALCRFAISVIFLNLYPQRNEVAIENGTIQFALAEFGQPPKAVRGSYQRVLIRFPGRLYLHQVVASLRGREHSKPIMTVAESRPPTSPQHYT